MLIECPHCEAKVDGVVIAEKVYAPRGVHEPEKYVFLQCPSCFEPLFGVSEYVQAEPDYEGWSHPARLWPQPQEEYHPSVPGLVRMSLDDAQKCYRAKVYSACAVMCGRALESICKEKIGDGTLASGLKKLRESNQIDDRLFNWGEALRRERNIGAHASEETVSRDDARDLVEFTQAIVEYIYTMSAKFKAYEDRKLKTSKKKSF